MAPDSICHVAADSTPSAAPPASANANATPASEPADKKHGHQQHQRGNRGGRDRGNDKQKRKHSGFGSAKYVPPFALPAFPRRVAITMPTLTPRAQE